MIIWCCSSLTLMNCCCPLALNYYIDVLFIIHITHIATGHILMLPCANTGAAIPTIKDTAAMIVTIAIKFNLDMHIS